MSTEKPKRKAGPRDSKLARGYVKRMSKDILGDGMRIGDKCTRLLRDVIEAKTQLFADSLLETDAKTVTPTVVRDTILQFPDWRVTFGRTGFPGLDNVKCDVMDTDHLRVQHGRLTPGKAEKIREGKIEGKNIVFIGKRKRNAAAEEEDAAPKRAKKSKSGEKKQKKPSGKKQKQTKPRASEDGEGSGPESNDVPAAVVEEAEASAAASAAEDAERSLSTEEAAATEAAEAAEATEEAAATAADSNPDEPSVDPVLPQEAEASA